ncbi:MAG: hypothetical protein R3C11_10480 [Planctomycetaceae bacterium]
MDNQSLRIDMSVETGAPLITQPIQKNDLSQIEVLDESNGRNLADPDGNSYG